jgi:hypothetical protein
LKNGPSLSQSCVWNVVGLGLTLDDWTGVIRKSEAHMNADAAGVLRAAQASAVRPVCLTSATCTWSIKFARMS